MPRSPEQQRAAKKERYDRYRSLCKQHSIAQQHDRWYAHLAELEGEPPFVRLTREQLQCWWTERFTPAEIYAMASAIDFLSVEEVAA